MNKAVRAVLLLACLAAAPVARAECPRVTLGGAMLLNIVPGFGIGSFARGDQEGGNIQLTADLVGLGLIGAGFLVASTGTAGWDLLLPLMVLGTSGMGVSLGSRIWGAGRAIWVEAGGGAVQGEGAVAVRNPFWYSMANVVFPGFGIGSFAQGDRVGGWVQVCLEAAGYVLLMIQMMYLQPAGLAVEAQTMGYVSGAVVVGARYLWGAARPLWFAACSRSTQTSSAVSLAVVPGRFSSTDRGEPAPGVRLALRVAME